MFNLKSDEISSLRVDIDGKLAILDARQKEILETLRGTYMYVYVLVYLYVYVCLYVWVCVCVCLYVACIFIFYYHTSVDGCMSHICIYICIISLDVQICTCLGVSTGVNRITRERGM